MTISTFKVEEGLEVETTDNTSQLLTGIVDPTQASGVSAPVSSLYTRNISDTESELYQKFGTSDTDWSKLATDAVAQASGTIGAAEDGSYLDGLFTDFSSVTPTGTAVDRFNEILKALAPSPSPTLSNISCSDTGVSGKLSFGVSNVVSGYESVTTSAGNSSVDLNGTYSVSGSRRGLFNGSVVINGVLADSVSANGTDYPANSFGSGDLGTLSLEVNGVVVHTEDLTTFGSGNSLNGNSSGFNLTSATPVEFADTTPLEQFKYRTGTWKVGVLDQRNGFNYARVIHNFNSNDNFTGFFEWVNDDNSSTLTSSLGNLDNLILTGSKYLSGINYNTDGTAEYDVTISSCHENVYSSSGSAVSFVSGNCSVSSQSLGNIVLETDTEVITNKLATIDSNIRLLDDGITVAVNCDHPLKSNLSSGDSLTINGILLDDINTSNTEIRERFCLENFRVQSIENVSLNDYVDQSDISLTWDSTESLVGSTLGNNTGLLVYNGALRSPLSGIDSGDFRNVSDGNVNGPSNGLSNPNYNGISGDRTYYRAFRNNSGLTKSNFRFLLSGSSTTFNSLSTGTLGNGVTLEVKFPTGSISTGTGWMDCYENFATNQWADGDGSRNATTGSGRALGSQWGQTLGTKSIADDEYIILRVTADSSWSGNISDITLEWL